MEINSRNIIMPVESIETDIARENELNSKLDEIWLKRAEEELGENETVRLERLKQLQERIAQDENIPHSRRDNEFLLRFLRVKKFDVDQSFRMLKKYLKTKRELPDLYRVSPVTDIQEMLKMQMQQTLPHMDKNGSLVHIFRVGYCDPYKWSVEMIFRANIMSLENTVRDPRAQIAGGVLLFDMAGLRLALARYLKPHIAKRSAEVIQGSFPMRFRAFHILHEPFYFDTILAIIKPFLKEKIRNRIYTHDNDLKSLHKHISIEILPREYGGTQGPFDNTKWREQILDDEEYFIRLETYSVN